MPSFTSDPTLLAILLLSFTNHAVNAISDATPSTMQATPAAVFQDSGSSIDGQFVFAVNVYQSNSSLNATADLYLHMSAPSTYQWMGVGLGTSMSDAIMWIAYPSRNGTSTTLSVRLSDGHHEPEYIDQSFGCEQIWGDVQTEGNAVTSGDNGTMTLDAVCRNVNTWNGSDAVAPELRTATNNTFVYAIGPHNGYGNHGGKKMRSDSLQASLNMHSCHGSFTMQMEQAVTNDSSFAGIPRPNGAKADEWVMENAASSKAAKKNYDPAPAIHGLVMCLTFVIIFPLGSLVLRVLQRVVLHAVLQAIGFALVCIATAAGIAISTKSRWSMHLNSAHQVIGVLAFIALTAQLVLGTVHHRMFKKQQQQQRQRPLITGIIHKFLGPAVILAGLINAPLGLALAGNPLLCLPYFAVLIVVALIFIGMRWRYSGRGPQKKVSSATPASSRWYGHAQTDDQASGEQLSASPVYEGSDDVPLRPYERQQSESVQMPAQPRPMI